MEYWWAYILAGLLCGIFSATFGVGSGIILIPALVVIFALPQKSAQGICLAVMVPMALAGAIRYKLNPEIKVDMVLVALLAAGGVVGALIGSSIAFMLPRQVLRKLFAVFMIVVAVRMLITTGRGAKPEATPETAPATQRQEAEP